jgi:hypothetical protein
VFSDPAGMQYHVSVTWNPGIQRYILAVGRSDNGLGIFEGKQPWGPWKTIFYGPFGLSTCKFTYQFSQRWFSADGLEMWMGWSGWPENDAVSFTKATMTRGEVLEPEAPGDVRVLE